MSRLANEKDPTPIPPKTPRAKRPARNILTAKMICLKRKAIYDSNAEKSPLLKLPPEIRTQIWSLVLGGLTIHVTRDYSQPTSILSRSICQHNTDSDRDHIKFIKSEHQLPTRHESYQDRHANCSSSIDNLGKRLALLQVCRQIHEEAALLPYSENTYTFLGLSALENFLHTTIPTQSQAIRSITYIRRTNVPRDAKTQVASEKTWFSRKLPDVRDLTCFVEFARDWRVEAFNSEEDRRGLEEKRILMLERLSVKDATVAAYCTFTECGAGEQSSEEMLDHDKARKWEKDIEGKLTAVWNSNDARKISEERSLKKEAKAAKLEDEQRQRRTRNRSSGGRLRSQRLLEGEFRNLALDDKSRSSRRTQLGTESEVAKRTSVKR